MRGKDFVGHWPSDPHWSEDGKSLYFDWNPENNPGDSLYRYQLGSKEAVKVSAVERSKLPPFHGEYNKAHTLKTYDHNGDVFLLNIKSGEVLQVTNTGAREHSPYFGKDDKSIHFQSDNNLFKWEIQSGNLVQLTDIRSGTAPQKATVTRQDQWVKNDQKALSTVVRERTEKNEQATKIREANKVKRPATIYLGESKLWDVKMSPKENFIAYTLYKEGKSKQTMVPEFVNESGYTEPLNTRSKVGSEPSDRDVWLYNLTSDSVYQVKTEDLPGIKDQPDYYKDYPSLAEKEPVNREVYSFGPFWSDNGNYAVMVYKSSDNKDRWITLLDPVAGTNTLLDRQRDEAWIGGPGMGYGAYSPGEIGWMPDNKSIWFQSEESGYSHLYTINVETIKKTALTSGNFEVYDPKISRDQKYWYFSSNEGDAGQRNFYKMPLNGGKAMQITSIKGRADVTLSHDEKSLAVLHSFANKPWELFVMDNKAGATMKQITHSSTKGFEGYKWRTPEFVTFTARDGAEVPARLYKPENAASNGPAVIFVHGAGYLQNAHKWWSSYYREYMFHNFLVDNGYTVLDIDYRASAGYGRDWRTAIYRHMGGWDLSDNVDGAKYLVEQHNIGSDRIGIYGGSYGGFITLMALFKEPEVFAAGAALRSVTDWAHYNHGYTSNILNTPVLDSIAYRRSSPIYYAENLTKPLLICHGMVDTNVHFQDVVRLSQRLIELGKDDWEMAVYPVEDHGFVEPSSWTDEYKRIFKLFETYLK